MSIAPNSLSFEYKRVFCCVPSHKLHGRCSPQIFDRIGICVLLETVCYLRTRETSYLPQILVQYAVVGACTAVMKLLEHISPPVPVSSEPIRQREPDGFVTGNKGLHLSQRF
jgi:hypothetical protein